ncbi:MAG TPA: hypothetical protein VKD47_08935 [Miltoncostaeaceae bacterium]|nr:hypothetical protein [Miltoncostaeaceae bacterium]
MANDDHIPEHLREYFGPDKVAFFGAGGSPAQLAPPESPARRQGEAAVADALGKVGTDAPRVGERPVTRPPKPALKRRMRMMSERALMEDSMRRLGRVPPHCESGALWRRGFVPLWRVLPWALRRRMLTIASGVKGWTRTG